MLTLYDFHWDMGRMGDVEGLFIADSEVVEKHIGKTVYFGEILGKHSDIDGVLEEEDLKVISEDQEKIAWLKEVMKGNTISGYNPITCIEEAEEDEL